MEWFILDVIDDEQNNEKFFAVRASEDIRFIIRVSTKAAVNAGDILTPVIDGYILNRNIKLTVKVNRVQPFTITCWYKARENNYRGSKQSLL
jgi:hypothetical protein